MSINTDRYTQLEAVLLLAGIDMMPSEAHGTAIGSIANHLKTGQSPDLVTLIAGVDHEQKPNVKQLHEVLYEIYRDEGEVMFSGEQGFELLLPNDGESLQTRVEALASWCQGYLLGLLNKEAFSIDELPESGAEIVRDIMQISEAGAGADEEREEDWALAELEEYVKVGAQLVFEFIYSERSMQAPTAVH